MAMTDAVRPFHGIRFASPLAERLSTLLCPPYDIITDSQREELYASDPHNIIRLEHPTPLAEDATEEMRYARAAAAYREWTRDGVMTTDAVPCFYVHDHTFFHRGRTHTRRGLVAAVRLRQWYDGVYPHELTGTKAKQDRLELMRACGVSFSYPLGIYEDGEGLVAEAIEKAVANAPRQDVSEAVDSHSFWVISDPDAIARIQQTLASEPLYIADGHHRYEPGLVYQAERQVAAGLSSDAGPHSYDYIPMTLTGFYDPGLFISPVSRVLRGFTLASTEDIEAGLQEFFTIDYVPLDTAMARNAPVGEMALMAVVGLREGLVAELRKKPGVELGAEVPGGHSSEYRTFNVSILNHIVMSKVMRIDPDGEGVGYSADLEDVVGSVQSGDAQLAFLLAPPHPLLVKKIADQQERMPRKSTYFYPKPPTGLVAYPLD